MAKNKKTPQKLDIEGLLAELIEELDYDLYKEIVVYQDSGMGALIKIVEKHLKLWEK